VPKVPEKRQNAASKNGHVVGNLPTDWRKLSEEQIRQLAVLSRGEREEYFPELKPRTRREWHTRLDELAEENAEEWSVW
jgi:hypothetical protein